MKNKAFIIGAMSSVLIISFLFIINYITSWGHPWFIYPTFAVIWWPLSAYFAENRNFKAFSAAGFILISVFFIWVNLVTSPGYLWCIYPIYAALWWPLSMALWGGGAKRYKLYSIVMSALTILFFFTINLISSPDTIWFFYPSIAITLWPLSIYFATKKYIKLYSVIVTLLITVSLFLINNYYTPETLWWTSTLFYLAWWPIVMLLGNRAKTTAFSIAAALVIIAYFIAQYLIETPGAHPWYLYIILPVLWWPVSTYFKDILHTKKFLLVTMFVFVLYYSILNIVLSPGYLWVIFLIYALSFPVMSIYFSSRKQYFAFSLCAAFTTILFFALVNYMNTPNHIWAVYPSFAILWWPLSYYFFKVKKTQIANH
jgi:hypothetical protein